jgi:hypothetical protein
MSRNLLALADLMVIWVHTHCAQQYLAMLAVLRDNKYRKHQLLPDILDSAAGDHRRRFFAITDSNDFRCLEPDIVEAFRTKMAGWGKAKVSERFLIDPC